jgi:beta-lactamase superfamily II metal-dependent hydrolase
MTGTTKVAIRMYHVGFGDAFRITITQENSTWRMLLDCGAHSQGLRQPIADSVREIIEDLAADCAPGPAHLDVVAATHHHADHISGFAVPAWTQVVVDEVWLPFVEDDNDPDTAKLKSGQVAVAQRIQSLVAKRVNQLAVESRSDPQKWPPSLAAAQAFAVNSSGNAAATDRLIGRNGNTFSNPSHAVRYLPSTTPAQNQIQIRTDILVHVLGPSRDPNDIKQMDPPAGDGWHNFAASDAPTSDNGSPAPLFKAKYEAPPTQIPRTLRESLTTLSLDQLSNDDGLMAAASILEQSVNNTSLFLVLNVSGNRFVFPGDSQYGAWEHVLHDPQNLALLQDAVFYKIGHHGSHNATPQQFVNQIWHDGAYAMLPWWLVKAWQTTIPFEPLLTALTNHHHPTIRQDSNIAISPDVTVIEGRWSEVVFTFNEQP